MEKEKNLLEEIGTDHLKNIEIGVMYDYEFDGEIIEIYKNVDGKWIIHKPGYDIHNAIIKINESKKHAKPSRLDVSRYKKRI